MAIELKQPLRPALYAEYKLVTSILDGTYPPGSSLPSERLLAARLHVTRPTLRETLHRLSSEGWVTIQHGRATTINDYWNEGGLRLLGTLAKYGELLSKEFISCLLEVRVVMLPPVARLAITNAPGLFADYLSGYTDLEDDPEKFASFDWNYRSSTPDIREIPSILLYSTIFPPSSESWHRTISVWKEGETPHGPTTENSSQQLMKVETMRRTS